MIFVQFFYFSFNRNRHRSIFWIHTSSNVHVWATFNLKIVIKKNIECSKPPSKLKHAKTGLNASGYKNHYALDRRLVPGRILSMNWLSRGCWVESRGNPSCEESLRRRRQRGQRKGHGLRWSGCPISHQVWNLPVYFSFWSLYLLCLESCERSKGFAPHLFLDQQKHVCTYSSFWVSYCWGFPETSLLIAAHLTVSLFLNSFRSNVW